MCSIVLSQNINIYYLIFTYTINASCPGFGINYQCIKRSYRLADEGESAGKKIKLRNLSIVCSSIPLVSHKKGPKKYPGEKN